MHSSSEQLSVEEAVASGIAALRAGNREQGHALLQYAVQLDPTNEIAWLWLSGAVTSEDERRQCLERVLAINPDNEAARRGLEQLASPQEAPAIGPLFPPPAVHPHVHQPAQRTVAVHPKQITETRYVDAVCTAEEWLDCLRDIAAYDAEGERLRRIFVWSAAVLFALGIIGAVITEDFAALLLFGGLAVLSLALFAIFKREDLPNSLRLFVVPLLAVLREDVEPGAPLALRLDLRGRTIAQKQIDQRSYDAGGGGYPRVVEAHYLDPWLAGSTRLADGSTLEWQIVDRVRARKVTKRTLRGKVKTKQKYKIRTSMEVAVRLRHDHYAVAADAAPAADAPSLKVKTGDKRDVIRVRRMLETRDINAQPELDHLLNLIAAAYRRARPLSEEHRL